VTGRFVGLNAMGGGDGNASREAARWDVDTLISNPLLPVGDEVVGLSKTLVGKKEVLKKIRPPTVPKKLHSNFTFTEESVGILIRGTGSRPLKTEYPTEFATVIRNALPGVLVRDTKTTGMFETDPSDFG
jgi:hypothetical protein